MTDRNHQQSLRFMAELVPNSTKLLQQLKDNVLKEATLEKKSKELIVMRVVYSHRRDALAACHTQVVRCLEAYDKALAGTMMTAIGIFPVDDLARAATVLKPMITEVELA